MKTLLLTITIICLTSVSAYASVNWDLADRYLLCAGFYNVLKTEGPKHIKTWYAGMDTHVEEKAELCIAKAKKMYGPIMSKSDFELRVWQCQKEMERQYEALGMNDFIGTFLPLCDVLGVK